MPVPNGTPKTLSFWVTVGMNASTTSSSIGSPVMSTIDSSGLSACISDPEL